MKEEEKKMIAPPNRTGPYSAFEMKTILTTLAESQEEFSEDKPRVYRKVSEALADNVFGRTPVQIQSLYGDLKKLYVNNRRFRIIVKSSPMFSPQEQEELKAILEENNMLHLNSILESPELLRLLAAVFQNHST